MDKNQLFINELLQKLATAQYEAVQLRAELTIANNHINELESSKELKGGDDE